MASKYVVYAGDERPAFIKANYIEKNSGQTRTEQGKKDQLYAVRPGDVGFPNMTEAWGVRLDKDGNIPKEPLSVISDKYAGKIKWLEWGDPKGCSIVARWLSGYDTLDQQYQKLVLKADDRISEDSDIWFITLQSGLNTFDENADRSKVDLLKITSYNQNSKSKNPNIVAYMFKEKDEVAELQDKGKIIDDKWYAVGVVKAAAADNSLISLKNLSKALSKLITVELDDENIYAELMNVADAQPDIFLGQIEEHKRWISNTFVKAESFKLLDLTKDGVIAAGKDLKEPIATGLPTKGKKMLDYILEHCFEEEASTTITKLKQITDKIN
jgi:hypothetical protein